MGPTAVDSVAWLIIKTWNWGVLLHSRHDSKGKELCAATMQLLQLLPAEERAKYQETVVENFEQIQSQATDSKV